MASLKLVSSRQIGSPDSLETKVIGKLYESFFYTLRYSGCGVRPATNPSTWKNKVGASEMQGKPQIEKEDDFGIIYTTKFYKHTAEAYVNPMRCEEAKEISESHPGGLSPPISLSWVLEGNPWVRKLLGSPPLRLSIPHRVLSLLLIWAAELSSHNTKNVIPPQTSKCFLGKNTSTVLWAFPAAKRFKSRFFHFFPSGSYP